MKILHLPENVGGHPGEISREEKRQGYDSTLLSLYQSKFKYQADINIGLSHSDNSLYRLYKHIETFFKFNDNYDIYHFNYGSSLLHFPSINLPLLDLPFYPKSSKKVMTFQGCDIRQKYLSMKRNKSLNNNIAACFENDCYGGICNSGKRDKFRAALEKKADKYCDVIFALNPDLLYFLPKNKTYFLPYAIQGFDSIPHKEWDFFRNDTFTIVHAPTQRGAKGTSYIIKALESLKEKYSNKIEIILVENLSYDRAIEIYKKADLFIDQVLVGWYGAVSVEVMKMGIPVAVFINHAHLENIQSQYSDFINDLPFFEINPFNIQERLEYLIKEREYLIELSLKAYKFVMKWHNSKAVVKQLHKILNI